MRAFARPVLIAAVACLAACVPGTRPPGAGPFPVSGFRIIEDRSGAETTFARMAARLARADVVFFGEQHDDPETHRAEVALLTALRTSSRPVIVSLEMFERDVQPVLDDYMAGRTSEQEFLEQSRPWPRYAGDYRPLIELAKERRWRVVAANVPRPVASAVGRAGLGVLDTSPGARVHAAREISCPHDEYHARFLEQMRSHSPGPGAAAQGDSLPAAMAERFYLAQCVKDETMAESIVDALRQSPNAIVVHFNGAFHSDYGQGVVARVRRREPGWDLATVSAVPVADPAAARIGTQRGRASFLILTRRGS